MDTPNINQVMAQLLANGVDFKVTHGRNSRDSLLASIMTKGLENGDVRIDFGDFKHGRLIRRIHEVNDHKAVLDAPALYRRAEQHRVTASWRVTSSRLKRAV